LRVERDSRFAIMHLTRRWRLHSPQGRLRGADGM